MKKEVCDVLVIGSGAAGLAAAARLKAEGVEDVLVLTESLRGGTSINTGSDKQTYYKLGMCGGSADSPMAMARTYFDGGAMHGDVALVEAALSARCFSHLCDIGVPFPHDAFGQYAGYKTDHDQARRATSVGPYTSREMCLRLLDECRMRGVRFAEGFVAVSLLTEPNAGDPERPLRCTGALAVTRGVCGEKSHAEFAESAEFKSHAESAENAEFGSHAEDAETAEFEPHAEFAENAEFGSHAEDAETAEFEPHAEFAENAETLFVRFCANDVVFAVGGPGGLYARSVYPACHVGGIGLALAAGARARNLPLSQFGLASTKFRWNVSGTYMQSLPRFVSTAADGVSDPRDFLLPAFGGDAAAAAGMVFLKGYQWPFDAAKAENGSSRIDLLVREETLGRGRRIFLDFRSEMPGLDPAALSDEARGYLEKSGALAGPPITRLLRMNPGAVALYREHGIDLAAEPLEIALCAQHNNGGLAADAWWQSENVAHLWPIGEVNGSHGIRRPGGSALNAGQVGACRCAEAIAARGGCKHHAEFAEDAERKHHAEFAEDAERKHHAEFAEDAEPDSNSVPPSERGVARSAGGSTPCNAIAREEARLAALLRGTRDWRVERCKLQERMDAAAGPLRNAAALSRAAEEARAQLAAIRADGFRIDIGAGGFSCQAAEALRTESLCLASVAYLESCLAEVEAGAGSRGSAVVLDGDAASGRVVPENPSFRALVQETELVSGDSRTLFSNKFVPVRPIPHPDDWFENVWRDYRNGLVFPNALPHPPLSLHAP